MSKLAVGSIEGLASEGYKISVPAGSKIVQAGAVLQVVSTTKTDAFSTTSSTYTTITGLSATITPTATSSKVLIYVTLYGFGTDGSTQGQIQLQRDSTAICIGDAASNRTRISGTLQAYATGSSSTIHQTHFHFLDSPSSTSAIVYAPYIKANGGGTAYVGRSQDDTDNSLRNRAACTITVMEIAG